MKKTTFRMFLTSLIVSAAAACTPANADVSVTTQYDDDNNIIVEVQKQETVETHTFPLVDTAGSPDAVPTMEEALETGTVTVTATGDTSTVESDDPAGGTDTTPAPEEDSGLEVADGSTSFVSATLSKTKELLSSALTVVSDAYENLIGSSPDTPQPDVPVTTDEPVVPTAEK